MATTYLTRTSGTPTSTKIGTFSVWFKRSKVGSEQNIFNASLDTNDRGYIQLDDGGGGIRIWAESSGSTIMDLRTNRLFRDTSGWYHLVVAWDTSQGTASNRVKMYINGVQQTSFSTETYPTQDAISMPWNISGYSVTLGSNYGGGGAFSSFYDGLMCHANFCDGTQYAASDFGSTDATSGEWVINTSPSVTYGDNGFFILKDGNSLTDQSGESNDFTLAAGTLTDLQDCPDDVFATFNPLYKSNETLSYANQKTSIPSGDKFGGCASIGVSKGKFYAEFMCANPSANDSAVGIYGNTSLASNNNQGVGKEANSYCYQSDGQKLIENTGSAYGSTYTDGDVIRIALDLDNNKLYFGKDAVWQNSGDPTSGATGTGAIPITFTPADGCWTISAGSASGGDSAVWKANFGNGYFADTAISSEGTNASGIGKFEYDVPTGYTALSTKGLQE